MVKILTKLLRRRCSRAETADSSLSGPEYREVSPGHCPNAPSFTAAGPGTTALGRDLGATASST